MKRALLIGAAALAVSSSLVVAQDSPESLLPPGFDDPAPAPTPTPRATVAPAPAAPQPAETRSGEVVQPIPSQGRSVASPSIELDLSNLPTLEELENMTTDELDELLGLKPKSDIPASARRSTERVGLLAVSEGGLPSGSLAKQPASLVRASLAGTKGPLVSRWGHILLRRALASRLAPPSGMDAIEFATLRAQLLNRMGEHSVARALVQDVDTGNYDQPLTNAAIDAYVGTADIVGACPAVRLVKTTRTDPVWKMLAGICAAYAGEETRAQNDLRRALNQGEGERLDVLLAQRFAGAAGQGRRAVTIEWDGVDDMTPWRFALANALGEPIPEEISRDLGPYYLRSMATAPMLGLMERARAAGFAAAGGILSSAAMVDLYSQIYAEEGLEGEAVQTAARLREAYVGDDPAVRLAAIKDIWGTDGDYGRLVLTAYAAARVTPSSDFADDAGRLIASMLTAGLDRDAMLWADVVDGGSEAWALLALARPGGNARVGGGDLDSFVDDDESRERRKSRMLVAGLAGLGRLESGQLGQYGSRLGVDFGSQTRWTRMIDRAAQVNNRALVAYLAGVGMQGDDWDRMTARHLYHIVSALNRVGLNAEARMIAAEAVARV